MSDLDLAAIKARAEAATEGPWEVSGEGPGYPVGIFSRLGTKSARTVIYPDSDYETGDPDLEFIAHARTDIPALIAEVERLRELVTDLNKQLDAKRQHDALGEDEDCGVCNHMAFCRLSEAYDELLEEGEQLRAKVEAVRGLHQPVNVEPSETICAGCSTLRGSGENARYFPYEEYPCPTIRALGVEP